MRKKEYYRKSPRRLPAVHLHGVDYFVDRRLRQFREVTNPHNYVDFDSETGKEMCAESVLLECPICGQPAVVSKYTTEGQVECVLCNKNFPISG